MKNSISEICFSKFVITGSKEEVKDLYQHLAAVFNEKSRPATGRFKSMGRVMEFYDIVKSYGDDYNQLFGIENYPESTEDENIGMLCSEPVYDEKENIIRMNWITPCGYNTIRTYLRVKNTGVVIYHCSVNKFHLGGYVTNDMENKFFHPKYCVWTEMQNGDIIEKFMSLPRLVSFTQKLIHNGIDQGETINETIEKWAKSMWVDGGIGYPKYEENAFEDPQKGWEEFQTALNVVRDAYKWFHDENVHGAE